MTQNGKQTPPPKLKWSHYVLIFVFIALIILLLWAIVYLWIDPNNPHKGKKFLVFESLNYEQILIMLSALGGALGALIHMVWSFGVRLGVQKFNDTWIPWYIFRPFVGIGLSLVFYFLIRGGLIFPTPINVPSQNNEQQLTENIIELSNRLSAEKDTATSIKILQTFKKWKDEKEAAESSEEGSGEEADNSENNTVPPLNPYGIMAISFLAGLFAKQGMQKLEEIFDALFKVEKEQYKEVPPEKDDGNGKNNDGGDGDGKADGDGKGGGDGK